MWRASASSTCMPSIIPGVKSPEQQRLRTIQPSVMAEGIAAVGTLDFKKDVTTAFCRETGKLCPARVCGPDRGARPRVIY